jgi:hypothetical protein
MRITINQLLDNCLISYFGDDGRREHDGRQRRHAGQRSDTARHRLIK